MIFAVMGGDMRMVSLARQLVMDGHEVRCFALEEAPEGALCSCAISAAAAAAGADCVILPLPMQDSRENLNAPMSAAPRPMAQLLKSIPAGALVCGGMPSESTRAAALAYGLVLRDYFAREELVVLNALATAEGALSLLLRNSPITVWESSVLVIGFGRIGRMLAERLRALGAEVTVSARKPSDFANIRAIGCRALDTRTLGGELAGFDTVINTVPAPVLGEARLRRLKSGVLCIDLASRPGGIDMQAAKDMGINVLWALGLPAETAPATAGSIIGETVFNIMAEREASE